MNVLVVEDEDTIAIPLQEGLEREGFVVQRVATGAAAVAASGYDIALLDLRLPDTDGLDVCRRIRAGSDVPIIIVSARGEEVDRVVGLEVGADDYLVKPYGMRELVARIRAVMRRRAPVRPAPDSSPGAAPLPGDDGSAAAIDTDTLAGPLRIDHRAHRVTIDDAPIELTTTEFDLLARLARDPGAVVTRRELLRDVWGTTWYGPTKTIDMHVANLRRKLGDPSWVQTVRGVGFRLDPPTGS